MQDPALVQRPRPAAKATRASQLAEALRGAILTGVLAPGEKVSLDRLRERYGVSLSPLREAMSRLASSGLVEMEDQRGYRIAPVSAANLAEITAMRAALGTVALQDSMAHADLDWESRIMGALHRLRRTSDGGGPDAVEAWRGFEEALHARCGMPMLMGQCRALFDLTARYMHLADVAAATCGPNLGRHADDLAQAALSGDAAHAADLLAALVTAQGHALARPILADQTALPPETDRP